ncbi:ZIP zinc transporter-domain-containing protein [Jimgerdemannia flammicorona]|uniref:ZIP zinc transporter-domain-containing protein n=1 Tax=Jimgerdemannia flammicorona TaxID=994334 RepID=A0A433QWE3_9FUNG|nr:ZIP zinc transporter-domain-containing protein [Jimgerdemannia flammicorona]
MALMLRDRHRVFVCRLIKRFTGKVRLNKYGWRIALGRSLLPVSMRKGTLTVTGTATPEFAASWPANQGDGKIFLADCEDSPLPNYHHTLFLFCSSTMKTCRSNACYYCTTALLSVAIMGLPAAVHAQTTANSSEGSPLQPDPCSANDRDGYDLPLHIASVFIIALTSALGAFTPLVASRFPGLRIPDSFITLGKHFGTGVILATGFIHMLPAAMSSLTSPCLSSAWTQDYPVYAALFAMFAALFMQLTEQLASENAEKRRRILLEKEQDAAQPISNDVPGPVFPQLKHSHEHEKHRHNHDHDHPDEADLTSVTTNGNNPHTPTHPVTPLTTVSSATTSVAPTAAARARVEDYAEDVATDITVSHIHSHHTHTHSRGNDHYPHNHHHHHAHPHGGHNHDHGIVFLENERKKISTYILEVGVATHSVIIGIALGVSSKNEFTGLLIALVFHQFFEGFALGARIAEVYTRSVLAAFMSLIYVLTTPLGIAIGIGISSTYNPNSTTALLTQGIFDSISAGILLYMAFVNLIAIEFTQNMRMHELGTRTKVSYYLAMYSGAAIMALIGRWA